jgi:hypothetical protein
MTPIFLLSLPRSGSTFVQRVLGAHPEIRTTAEPWILLPLLYSLKSRGIYTEYGQEWATVAIADFCERLPRGEADYRAAIRAFALDLYAKAGGGEGRYFLDKTPRYHLVVEEIIALFPDAKFVVLWRHPLAVVASIIDSFGGGRWNLQDYAIDLYSGLASLIEASRRHSELAFSVRYEDLIAQPDATWPGLFAHLGLQYDPQMLVRFVEVPVAARVGDQIGTRAYRAPSTEPLDKWRGVLTNPLRKAWCRRYLRWLGKERLAHMGYDLAALEAELAGVRGDWRRLGPDLASGALKAAFGAFELRMMKDKWVDPRPAARLTPHH